jgi:hypothetical protein
MNLEDLFEARLAGEQPEVPEALGDDLKHALAAHEALQFALGETILLPASEAADRIPPQLPADYEIVRELGRGGMGVVYLARQKSLDRLVAVKVLRPGELAFGPMVRRFLDEAKHLARLRHPNLVSVHEVGEAGGEPYFSMDFIEGESLADLLRSEQNVDSAADVLRQLGATHSHEIAMNHSRPAIGLPVQNGPFEIGVADGRYRLTGGWTSANIAGKELAELYYKLVVDKSALPAVIEVRGETIDLPPIRVRVLDEIKALSPSVGASIDLQTTNFRWTPIRGAASYQVTVNVNVDDAGTHSRGVIARTDGTTTDFCLGATPGWQRNFIEPQKMVRGRGGVWAVSAFDANNVEIGKTFGRGTRFRLSRGLDGFNERP